MSWFSRSFSMSDDEDDDGGEGEPAAERDADDDDDDEEEEEEEEEEDAAKREGGDEGTDLLNFAAIASATGAIVKEDLSNLTKTFSGQLWGVASFLAPLPPPKSASGERREEERREEERREGEEHRAEGISGGVQEVSESESGRGFGTLGRNVPGPSSAAAVAAIEIPEQAMAFSGAADQNEADFRAERPIMTGLRSDFAELRGTVASGFSRISSVLGVVAGDDIEDDDDDKGGRGSEHEETVLSAVSARETSRPLFGSAGDDNQTVNSPRLGLDTFLKPLFGHMAKREASPVEKGDAWGSEDDDEAGPKDAVGRSAYGEGESGYRELDSLPSVIASGIDGISKFASTLLQSFGEDDESEEYELEHGDRAAGLTEAVVTFARNVSSHPETWLDFPLTDDDANDDFALTLAQKEHVRALAVVAPGLGALKTKLCPAYLTEERFWKIYFVLMHSRLSSNEEVVLSTKQVARARTSMLNELHKRELQSGKALQHEGSAREDVESSAYGGDHRRAAYPSADHGEMNPAGNLLPPSSLDLNPLGDPSFGDLRQPGKMDLPTSSSKESEPVEHQPSPGKGRISVLHMQDEAEVDEWLEEEPLTEHHAEAKGTRANFDASIADDEDVSFSDLEEEDVLAKGTRTSEMANTSSTPKSSNSTVAASNSTLPSVLAEGSSPSTQGDGTPRKSSEFNDWLTVDQDDVVSADSSP